MIRAGIFVGVDRTGQLPLLHDAAEGARRMRDWAVGSGMVAPEQATLLTDAGGATVTPDQIYAAIAGIVDGPGVDQLLLYFAGHGVNINRSEVWLLSDAPQRTSAAVNVRGSVELARYCGIPHVVMVSDACRVAPEGIQAQNVIGQDVFPNNAASDRSHPVDQLFACRLGRTAAEIRDPGEAAAGYSALYTGELLRALHGEVPGLLEAGADATGAARFLYPRPLAQHLEAAVPRIVGARGLIARVNQVPDAIITSHDLWLARLPPAAGSDMPGATTPRRARRKAPGIDPQPRTKGLPGGTGVRAAGQAPRHPPARRVRLPGTVAAPALHHPELRLAALRRISAPFGPQQFPSRCGIKVRGAQVAAAVAGYAQVRRLEGTPAQVEVDAIDGPAASVLLQFADGSGALVPVLRDHVSALTFVDGELVDMAWEPSANHGRRAGYAPRADELRALRAVAATATRNGRFRLDAAAADQLASAMQYGGLPDPSLALYAAYAIHEADLDPEARIGSLARLLDADLGAGFFDLAMLARRLRGRRVEPGDMLVPCVPLLAQGWALMRALGARPHPALEGLESTVRQSPWSLYGPRGVERIRQALSTREVR